MNYDEIGLIAKTPGTYDDEGNELRAPVYQSGWHVNALEPVPEWEQYRIPTPETPTRVYAGGIMPVCYRFESKEQFESLLPEVGDETDQ
jgi:hypothetical protein